MERRRDFCPSFSLERRDGAERKGFFGVEEEKEFPPKIKERTQVWSPVDVTVGHDSLTVISSLIPNPQRR